MTAVVMLASGILAGLARVPVNVPAHSMQLAAWHGVMMIPAFFGTVISLERAVALRTPLSYAAPLLNAIGALALLVLGSVTAMQLFTLIASVALLIVSIRLAQQMAADFTALLAVAAGCWVLGNLAWWVSDDPGRSTWLWLAFLVITIAAERLELTRFLRTSRIAKRWCYAVLALIAVGALLATFVDHKAGRIFSAGLLMLAVWLARHDIARHNIRQKGITRYIAACLFGGYVWLGIAGWLGIFGAMEPGHTLRDAALHALALGFVLAMVFGHALIIVPAITGLKLPYHWAFYIPLGLLHGSLSLRALGRSMDSMMLAQWGAIANAATLMVFAALLLWRIHCGLVKA